MTPIVVLLGALAFDDGLVQPLEVGVPVPRTAHPTHLAARTAARTAVATGATMVLVFLLLLRIFLS